MEGVAKLRYLRITPLKVNRLVREIRGKSVHDAMDLLRFAPQSAGRVLHKLLSSAVSNAYEKSTIDGSRFDESRLYIAEIKVDEGPTMKRFRPRAQGRAGRILRRTSHVTITVRERQGK